MIFDDYDTWGWAGLSFPDVCPTVEETPWKNPQPEN